MKELIQKIIDNQNVIIGIKLDGIFYDVDCVLIGSDTDANDLIGDTELIKAHQIDNDLVIGYELSVQDIADAKEVKLYKLQEI